MRAAVVSNDPAATPVSVADVPTPERQPGWVRARLHRAALNRLDAMMIATRVELDRPAIFGSDGAGIVDAVGGGVTDIAVGSEVVLSPSVRWGSDPQAPGPQYEIIGSPTDGTHAEYVVVPAENVHPKPSRLSMAEAAALPMAGSTAWRALVTRGRLTAGEKVVVAAASSGVGTMAIQIAKGLGADVVAITSPDNANPVRRLGADQIVLRTKHDLADRLSAATEGRADLALDPTGALWQPLLQALRPGGRLVAVGKMAAEIAEPRVQTAYWKQVDILGSSMGSPDDVQNLLAHLEGSSWAPDHRLDLPTRGDPGRLCPPGPPRPDRQGHARHHRRRGPLMCQLLMTGARRGRRPSRTRFCKLLRRLHPAQHGRGVDTVHAIRLRNSRRLPRRVLGLGTERVGASERLPRCTRASAPICRAGPGQRPTTTSAGVCPDRADRRGPGGDAGGAAGRAGDGLAGIDPAGPVSLRATRRQRLPRASRGDRPQDRGDRRPGPRPGGVRRRGRGRPSAAWAWHQTLADPDHLEAARVLRRTRIGALRPVREPDTQPAVEQRSLTDYDTALGIELGPDA